MCKSFSTIRRGFTILATITGLAFATATSSLAMTLEFEFEFEGVTGTILGLENDVIRQQADSVFVKAPSGSDVDFSSPFAD